MRIVFQNAAVSEIATLEQIGKDPNRMLRSERPILSELINANKLTAQNVRFLIGKGADPLLRDGLGNLPILFAVMNNKSEIFDVLLEASGASVVNAQQHHRKDGCSLLHIAVLNGHREIAEKLAAAGAYVNARDMQGATPLCVAVRTLNSGMVEYLIEKGADIVKYESETGASLVGMLKTSRDTGLHDPLEKKIEGLLLDAGARPPSRSFSPSLSSA